MAVSLLPAMHASFLRLPISLIGRPKLGTSAFLSHVFDPAGFDQLDDLPAMFRLLLTFERTKQLSAACAAKRPVTIGIQAPRRPGMLAVAVAITAGLFAEMLEIRITFAHDRLLLPIGIQGIYGESDELEFVAERSTGELSRRNYD